MKNFNNPTNLGITMILFVLALMSCADEHNYRSTIIIKFKEDVISKEIKSLPTSCLNNSKLRDVFKSYSVDTINAVYANRYGTNGVIKYLTNDPEGLCWRKISIPNKFCDNIIEEFKTMNTIDTAYKEKPLALTPCRVPTDSRYSSQWSLNNPAFPGADINAERAWDINVGRNDIIIAVCDGGIDYTHPDLDPGDRSRIIQGYDTGSNDNDPMDNLPDAATESYASHGTNIAGVIGAITDNNTGISGVMWNCKIMPLKMVKSGKIKGPFGGTIIDFSEAALPSDVADAIDYARNNGAHVINLSYGFEDMGYLVNEIALRVPLLARTIREAYNGNILVVASMGNDFENGNPKMYPAAFNEYVVAVGATNNLMQKASFSSTGNHIDLCAPGQHIQTTRRGGTYQSVSGTSFSAPIVCAVSGLLLSHSKDRNLHLTNDDLKKILEITATDLGQPGFDEEFGHGLVNAEEALMLIDEPNSVTHGVSYGGNATKTNLNKWNITGGEWSNIAAGMYLNVDRYTVTKHVTFEKSYCDPPHVWIRKRESLCLSAQNPNSGYQRAEISNVTKTGFDVKYYTYYVRYNTGGQAINQYVPARPQDSKIEYTVVGTINDVGNPSPINGSSIVCTSPTTFTVTNIDPHLSISWEHSSTLRYVSGQNTNSYTVKANSSTLGTGGWIRVKIKGQCEHVVQRKIWVGVPEAHTLELNNQDILNGLETCPGEYTSIHINDPYGMQINHSDWGFPSNFWIYSSGDDYVNFSTPTNFDYAEIPLTVTNTCGDSTFEFELYNGYCGGGYYTMSMSPNPSTTETTISIEPDFLKQETAPLRTSLDVNTFDDNVQWEYAVYSKDNRLKEKKSKLKGKSIRINTSGWKPGIYIIRAKYKDKVISGKLIVE